MYTVTVIREGVYAVAKANDPTEIIVIAEVDEAIRIAEELDFIEDNK